MSQHAVQWFRGHVWPLLTGISAAGAVLARVLGPAELALSLAILAATFALVWMQSRGEARNARRLGSIERSIRSLQEEVRADHQRASAWNYHLRLDLGLPPLGPRNQPSTDGQNLTTVPTKPVERVVDLGTHRPKAEWQAPWKPTPALLSLILAEPMSAEEINAAVNDIRHEAEELGFHLETIVPAGNGSGRPKGPTVVEVVSGTTLVEAWNACLLASSGELALIWGKSMSSRGSMLRSLVEAISTESTFAAIPMILNEDDTIYCAGYGFVARKVLPVPLLAGHARDDARYLPPAEVSGASGKAVLLDVALVRKVAGFLENLEEDISSVELCLRAAAHTDTKVLLCGSAQATYTGSDTKIQALQDTSSRRDLLRLWPDVSPERDLELLRAAGFSVASVGSDRHRVPAPSPLLVRETAAPKRWGIRIASDPGPKGDSWGDTIFAESLAEALRSQGMVTVVHRHAPSRNSDVFDDISLVLRGKFREKVLPGRINVLWVISHPESVTVAEVQDFDLVFAASEFWATKMSRLSHRRVLPLLQATDPKRFNPSVAPVPVDAPIFVGGRHLGRERLMAATQTGTRLAVFGHGWEDALPSDWLKGNGIPNEDLAAYYRGAPAVVADHWPEMRDNGFIQNRVFDAVAAGCRVISDAVPGVTDLFAGAVQTYDTPSQFVELCDPRSSTLFPSDTECAQIGRDVGRRHSFAERARRLIEAVADFEA